MVAPFQPVLKYIRKFIADSELKPAPDVDKVKDWLSCQSLPSFLERTSERWLLIHLATSDYFVNSFTIESRHSELFRSKEALDVSFGLSSGVSSYGYGWSNEAKKHFYEVSTERGPGESRMFPLFFSRSFEGNRRGPSSYYEMLQEFIHFAGLHWIGDKSAFCTLSDVGDLEERVLVLDEDEFSAILVERSCLELYLLYRDHFLCRFLEIKRAMPGANWSGNSRGEPSYLSTEDRTSWIRLWPSIPDNVNAACDLVRATQVVFPTRTIEELEEPKKEYAKFLIQDWKSDRIVEWTCDPDELDNYFVDTGKPFSTSPVFFRADVLLKYKSEPEKYEFSERSIWCRGAWSLRTYDVNEEGQVHTYACYLGNLPHQEQLHWKQFNEEPKATISQRAYATDFEARWVEEYNPLHLIKCHLKSLPSLLTEKGAIAIWRPKEDLEALARNVHYVTAGKVAEYKDFLMALTILVVDGLDAAVLAEFAEPHARYDRNMKSLGCLKLVLLRLGLDEAGADKVISPLRELQEKRSKYAGHGGAQPDFDLVADCRSVLETVETSLEAMANVLGSASLTAQT